jgi:hypothetical protein
VASANSGEHGRCRLRRSVASGVQHWRAATVVAQVATRRGGISEGKRSTDSRSSRRRASMRGAAAAYDEGKIELQQPLGRERGTNNDEGRGRSADGTPIYRVRLELSRRR